MAPAAGVLRTSSVGAAAGRAAAPALVPAPVEEVAAGSAARTGATAASKTIAARASAGSSIVPAAPRGPFGPACLESIAIVPDAQSVVTSPCWLKARGVVP